MKNTVYDFLGNKYSSLSQMCKKYNISVPAYQYRIASGWTQQDALTIKSARENTSCEDHLGNKFKSEIEMCNAYGVKQNTYAQRIKNGWSIKDALVKRAKKRSKRCLDHLGNEFSSETEMCKFHNINRKLYVGRRQLGWSLEEALSPTYKNTGKACMDHNGKEFRSYADLCRFYNIDWGTFKGRRERGWSLEDILTKDVGHKCVDHLGKSYDSMTDMCKEYNISFPMYQKRVLSYGWTKEEALTIPRNSSLGEVRIAKYLDNRQIEYYHDITLKRLFKEISMENFYSEFLAEIYRQLKESGSEISKNRIAKMRFDFSLIHNKELFAFIEFDGEQHFSWVDIFFNTIEEFLLRHSADEVKNVFSEHGNIPLLRIRYDQVDYIPEMIDHLLGNPSFYLHQHNTFLDNDKYWEIFNELSICVE